MVMQLSAGMETALLSVTLALLPMRTNCTPPPRLSPQIDLILWEALNGRESPAHCCNSMDQYWSWLCCERQTERWRANKILVTVEHLPRNKCHKLFRSFMRTSFNCQTLSGKDSGNHKTPCRPLQTKDQDQHKTSSCCSLQRMSGMSTIQKRRKRFH